MKHKGASYTYIHNGVMHFGIRPEKRKYEVFPVDPHGTSWKLWPVIVYARSHGEAKSRALEIIGDPWENPNFKELRARLAQ